MYVLSPLYCISELGDQFLMACQLVKRVGMLIIYILVIAFSLYFTGRSIPLKEFLLSWQSYGFNTETKCVVVSNEVIS